MKTAIAPLAFSCLFALLLLTAHASATPAESTPEIIAEYCKRVKDVSPRDAEGQYAIGVWCRENGLESEAVAAFRRVLSIDGDHAGAREALGDVRHGTRWIKKGTKTHSARPVVVKGATPPPGTSKTTTGTEATPPATTNATPRMLPTKQATRESTTTPTIETVDPAAAAIAEKLELAKLIASTLQTPFLPPIEDDEFLIHTTYSSTRDPQVRLLRAQLKKLRKDLGSYLGVKSSTDLWPERIQFFFLRSRQQYERFAEVIDKIKEKVNPDGAYVSEGGYVVLWKPTSVEIARHMGTTAFDRMNSSDRWVAWWLKEGVGEMLAAMSPEGLASEHYQKNYRYSEKYVESEDEGVTIHTLLETRSYKRRNQQRSRALAMTFVDFLNKKSSRGFRSFVKALKSDKAPPPPDPDSENEADFLSYWAFQREQLLTSFRTTEGKLEAAWKLYVLKRAESIKKTGEGKQTR